jgi:hypothetical protein
MNKLLVILLLTATNAFAQLIDLTPGGFSPSNPPPGVVEELFAQVFFDEAAHGFFDLPPPIGTVYLNQWVSMFGELDGGVYFFTNLFTLGDTPSASIWWDFRRLNGFGLTMLDVWGRKPDGTAWEHIYAVRPSKAKKSHPVLVTLDGMTFIQSIAFYGKDELMRGPNRPAILLRYFEK